MIIARFLFPLLAFSWTFGQTLDGIILPSKTEIFITLERTLTTRTASSGEKFHARTIVPVTLEDRIIIPVGSYMIGHVETSDRPGHLKGQAKLLLAFDTVILPDGTTRRIEAVVQSAELNRIDPSNEKGTLHAPGSQGKETAAGAVGGAAAGAGIGALANRSAEGLAIGAAIGSGAGALLGLFKKGDQIVLQKGTSLTVQLQTPVRFSKLPSRTRGTPLTP